MSVQQHWAFPATGRNSDNNRSRRKVGIAHPYTGDRKWFNLREGDASCGTMLTALIPKLPMRDPAATRAYFVDRLGFTVIGQYADYLIMELDGLEIHFFLHADLDPLTNDGQLYIRTNAIDDLYRSLADRGVAIHPNGALATKPWGQREFALLDPDHNLLTFGEAV